MCGLFAVFSPQHRDYPYPRETLAHRGPDGFGAWYDERIYLAHHRLSIIDLSVGGAQPRECSTGRYRMVYNGEVYNYRDIRSDLENNHGASFKTESDSEVILEAFVHYGVDAFAMFRGMFAIVIYDTNDGSLIVARDRFGVKPLLYSANSDGVAFASEARAFHAAGWSEARINQAGLNSLFTHGAIAQPLTLFDGISAVMPGHYMVVDRDYNLEVERYCDLFDDVKIRDDITYDEAVKGLRSKLEDVIALNCVADTEVGCFLSGGVDSTSILALMSQQSDARVKAFSVGFTHDELGDDVEDESDIAARSANELDADFKRIILDDDKISTLFDGFINALDQPSIDGFNTYIVSAVAGQDVKVALSGVGGDELFIGYGFHRRVFEASSQKPNAALRAAQPLLRAVYSRWPKNAFKALLLKGMNIGAAIDVSRHVFTPWQRRNMLRNAPPRCTRYKGDVPTVHGSSVQALSAYEMRNYMLNTLLRDSDVMSMRHGLEVRPPLLDHELARYVMALPDEFKVKDGAMAKGLFIDALKDLIPDEVYNRVKTGFELPYARWMNGAIHAPISKAWNDARAADLYHPAFIKAMRKACKKRSLTRADWLPCVMMVWYLRQDGLALNSITHL